MKSLLAAMLIAIAPGAVLAQTADEPKRVKTIPIGPANAQTAPAKRVRTISIKPAETQTPAATANAMTDSARLALQSDLAWVGTYNGLINGEASDRLVASIRAYQKDHGAKQTGVLNPQERADLAAAARTISDRVGWKIGIDPINGIRLGLPTKLAPVQSTGSSGSKWSSAQGQIQIETWRAKDTNLTLGAMADREAKEAGRKVEYRVLKDDFFVLSGMQNLKRFYVRGANKGNEVRGLTILYDQATEGTMAPVTVLMSSAFSPFPANAALPADGPPPRKAVEYSTGIVASPDGAIVVDRLAVDGCQSIVVPAYGNADRIAEEKTYDLALLRIYGTNDLKPLAIGSTAASAPLRIVGVADPQSQAGGSAISFVDTAVVPTTNGGEATLQATPPIGFSGSAIVDGNGRFAGVAILKPQMIATAQNASPQPQAVLVSSDVVREFLKANNVALGDGDGGGDPKASIVRVICVRK